LLNIKVDVPLRCAVQVWDLRQNKLIYSMHGHSDSITGLSLSSEGSYLLSNSMDNTGRGVCLVGAL
jgi:WD40 repeat protein